MSLNFYCEEEDQTTRGVSINQYKFLFNDYEDNPPNLSEAITQIYKEALFLNDSIINETINEILNNCQKRIDSEFDTIKKQYNNITKEDAYIICSYTYETKNRALSPYRLLNQCLTYDDRKNGVSCVSKYLYILLKSLRKLPRYYPNDKYLYRCLTCHVNISQENNKNTSYFNGNKKTFWAFTSTSPDPNTTYSFLKGQENQRTGTVFTLGGDIWGYNIEIFNYYREKEILLEPERKYIIDNVLPPLNGIINISCTILKTNLVLNDGEIESNIKSHNTNEKEKSLDINDFLAKFEMEVKINGENKLISGMGIFCNIPSKNIKAFITYNHMINFDILNNGEKMLLYINKREKEVNIKINRYKYTNKDLDITIIEMLDIDNIFNFIELDKFIYSRNYIGTNIISVSLNDNGDFDQTQGKILDKNNENYICNIDSKHEGIILLKDNMKLIGIIKGNKKEIEIISMIKIINNISFIKCIYEIKTENINRDIQIFNNKDSHGIIKNREIEKEIKVIINGEIKSNILSYKFDKEGDYPIYLLSYNNITNLSNIFRSCTSLKELNLSSFNFNEVINMSYMCYKCSSLKKINLSSLTNKVTSMMFMFGDCSLLKKIDLSSFNTNQVTNMSYMFNNCSSLQEINLSSFNTSQVTNMSYMFNNCSSLKELDLSSFNTSQLIDMSNMFHNCTSLQKINLSSFNTHKVINLKSLFYNCSSLKELNLSSFNTNKVTDMSNMFYNCSSLADLNISSFFTSQVTDMSNMFNKCSSLQAINLLSFQTIRVSNMSCMFKDCSSIKILNLATFNTMQVTNMSSMFEGCSSLIEIHLSSFITPKVFNMSCMFKNCSSLKLLNLSSFSTELVNNMSSMFEGCLSLEYLNLSKIIINETIDITNLFNSGNKLCKIISKDKRINKELKKLKSEGADECILL